MRKHELEDLKSELSFYKRRYVDLYEELMETFTLGEVWYNQKDNNIFLTFRIQGPHLYRLYSKNGHIGFTSKKHLNHFGYFFIGFFR